MASTGAAPPPPPLPEGYPSTEPPPLPAGYPPTEPAPPAGYPATESTYPAPPSAPNPPPAPERYPEENEKHWGHFGVGVGLSFLFSLFALFGLFFIDKSQQKKKFYLYGCAVGIALNILLALLLWFLGFAFLSILIRK